MEGPLGTKQREGRLASAGMEAAGTKEDRSQDSELDRPAVMS